MTRTISFLEVADGPAPAPGVEHIVIDTAWSPIPGGRSGLRPLRPLVRAALVAGQPYAEAMDLLDRWAADCGLIDRMASGGISHWYRRRIVYWRWLHDRIVWRRVIGGLLDEGPIDRVVLPRGEPELHDVVMALAGDTGWAVVVPPDPLPPAPSAGADRRPALQAIARLLPRSPSTRRQADARRRATADRMAILDRRVREIAAGPRSALILSNPAMWQAVTVGGRTELRDTFLEPIAAELAAGGLAPAWLETSTDVTDASWPGLTAPGHERVLPGRLLATRYADLRDADEGDRVAGVIADRLPRTFAPLSVDGLDLGPLVEADLRSFVATGLPSAFRAAARARRLLEELRPAVVLMINEYSRAEWIEAARAAGVPVAAVQHGVIHRWHPGYITPPAAHMVPRVDRTYVFGPWEARLLVAEGGYDPDTVAVAGSPRLDFLAGVTDTTARRAIRAELGIQPDARLVVISSTSSIEARRFAIAAALDGILDRPLPGVHLVVKLHPGEDDGTFYGRFVEGIARARGFAPPPCTTVRTIDLYRLLAAADAHLGLSSTVLTDAVAAGTPNLIITSLAGADLLGYVAAGVARPVRDGGDLLAALVEPPAPGVADRRAAFLADHFAGGRAAERIAADLVARFGGDRR